MKALAEDGPSGAGVHPWPAPDRRMPDVQKEIKCSNVIDIAPDLGICHARYFIAAERGSGFFFVPGTVPAKTLQARGG